MSAFIAVHVTADESSPLVRVTREGLIAVVTMNRPEKRNAMNEELLEALFVAMRQVSRDDSVRAVVVTGEGVAFSAGADRSAIVGLVGEERALAFAPIGTHLAALMWKVMDEVMAMPKAVIAAVNGSAVGGGMMLALASDFRVVATDAEWWLPEIELGFSLSEKTTSILRDFVGRAGAKEIGMLARRLSVSDVERMGMATSTASPRETMTEAMALARRIVALKPSAVATVKSRIHTRLHE